MHNLSRKVRFSIDPFLPQDAGGFNSFSSKPAGEGLSIFFELCVELTGEVEPSTGFITNVIDIDKNVRKYVVPVFAERIRKDFRSGSHIGLPGITELLKSARGQLADKFGTAKLNRIGLALNPFRTITLGGEPRPNTVGRDEDCKMVYLSEKFEFAATHKLWNEQFSKQRNFEVFGKCANPTGHGHNYIVEVTIKTAADRNKLTAIADFEKTVDNELIRVVDHKNLNVDIPYFSEIIPTVENIAAFAWERIAGKFGDSTLHCVTVWETDRTCCSYYG